MTMLYVKRRYLHEIFISKDSVISKIPNVELIFYLFFVCATVVNGGVSFSIMYVDLLISIQGTGHPDIFSDYSYNVV